MKKIKGSARLTLISQGRNRLKPLNMVFKPELGKFPLIITISQKILYSTLYLQSKGNDPVVKQVLFNVDRYFLF